MVILTPVDSVVVIRRLFIYRLWRMLVLNFGPQVSSMENAFALHARRRLIPCHLVEALVLSPRAVSLRDGTSGHSLAIPRL